MENKSMTETMREIQDAELEKVSGGEQSGGLPQITFMTDPPISGPRKQRITVKWKTLNALTVEIYVDGHRIYLTAADAAEGQHTFGLRPGVHTIRLVANNVVGDVESYSAYKVYDD